MKKRRSRTIRMAGDNLASLRRISTAKTREELEREARIPASTQG